jgi:Uma2 family endonuclease
VAETPLHRDNLLGLIEMFRDHYRGDPSVYISGNMFLYFEEGNPRRSVSPDVFVALGIGDAERDAYFTWKEGKGPDLVVELTSPRTRKEDFDKKFTIYQDVLKVPEYFLFDPRSQYLDPPLQGYRLREGRYERIEPIDGRLPSATTGLHLERDGRDVKLFDPRTGVTYPTLAERADQRAEAEARIAAERKRADEAIAAERAKTNSERKRADEAIAELERLQLEIEALKRGSH